MSKTRGLRTCVGCRARREPAFLVRIVGTSDGALRPSVSSCGRGAWLCSGSVSCLEAATRSKAFERMLRQQVAPVAIEALRERLG